MSKSSRKFQTFFFSIAGVAVMAATLVVLNIIANQIYVRKDFTEDQLYTLSEGSKDILRKITTPATIRFYCTRGKTEMPVALKNYATRIADLLKEYEIAGGGKIRVEKYDPSPDSDAEDAAALDGIEGQQLSTGEKIYLGIAVNCIDETQSIPFLSPQNENTLEYDITRLIVRVANPTEVTIGIMSTLPVMGKQDPAMRFQQRQQNQEPWIFVSELKKDYQVREISSDVKRIPDDIDVLIVHHPKEFSDETMYALDQFVLRGGRMVALVDPISYIEPQFRDDSAESPLPPGPSNLKPLFDAWGIEYDTNKVLVDMKYPTTVGGPGGAQQVSPTVLTLDNRSMNAKDIVSGSLDKLLFAYAGAFTGEPAEGLTKTVLISSSNESQLVESYRAQLPLDSIQKNFKSDDKEYALAIRLVGTFRTAFPDGAPKTDDDDDGEDSSGDSEVPEHLSESSESGAVIIIADADMIYDELWVRKANILGLFSTHQIISDNNNLLQNGVEQLSGDNSLISIRSRGVTNRPFLVVKDMQLEAEKKYKQEISQLEEELSEARRKINELQTTKKDQSQRYILSQEQLNELEKFREKEVEAKKELKELRKQLRKDVDRLETTIKWCNIGLMPFIVTIAGIFFAIIRKRNMAS